MGLKLGIPNLKSSLNKQMIATGYTIEIQLMMYPSVNKYASQYKMYTQMLMRQLKIFGRILLLI